MRADRGVGGVQGCANRLPPRWGLVIRYKLAERIGGRKKGKRGIKPRDKKVIGILERKKKLQWYSEDQNHFSCNKI
jgi:hypothetical protein